MFLCVVQKDEENERTNRRRTRSGAVSEDGGQGGRETRSRTMSAETSLQDAGSKAVSNSVNILEKLRVIQMSNV